MSLLSSVASSHLPVTGKLSFHSLRMFFSELTHLPFKNHLFEYCKLRASLYQKALFLSQLNNFLCTVRSRAVFDKSTDPGNDWMVAQFVFLFLAHPIFQETSTEMGIKIILMPIIILLSMLL